MDKYHIYEEIGKGSFSQVFKGREKKRVEYVAIKRVEKSMMNKIVNEVQIIHKLESPHVLRFYDWYETRNNLWLILEYCTGSDLESLLKQDGHLPENSVRMFGLDILAGLRYLHSMGIIHCDVRPKNFLIDEYGILKVCDFNFARKIPKTNVESLPLDARGSGPCMAPELFSDDGVYSYQSDFWAFGTLLYMLRRGAPAFAYDDTKLSDIAKRVRSVEPVSKPVIGPPVKDEPKSSKKRENAKSANDDLGLLPPFSAELADLLLWMLEKAPDDRCDWASLCTHPFWGPHKTNPPPNLPQQPAYSEYIQSLEKHHENMIEESLLKEFGILALTFDDAISAMESSAANTLFGKNKSAPYQEAVVDPMPNKHENKFPESTLDNKKEGKGALPTDVQDTSMVTPDAPRDQGTGATRQVAGNRASSFTSDVQSSRAAIHSRESRAEKVGKDETERALGKDGTAITADARHENGDEREGVRAASNADRPVDHNNGMGDMALVSIQEHPATADDEFSVEKIVNHSSDTQVKPIVGNKAIEVIEKSAVKLSALTSYFQPVNIDELAVYAQAQLEGHLTQVYKALMRVTPPPAGGGGGPGGPLTAGGSSSSPRSLSATQDRANILAYINSISCNADVANTVLNTPFLLTLLRSIRQSSSTSGKDTGTSSLRHHTSSSAPSSTLSAQIQSAVTSCRVNAATALASLIRYATYVGPATNKDKEDHILPTLCALLREGGPNAYGYGTTSAGNSQKVDLKLKRRAIAALGELIFYITAQDEEGDAQEDQHSPEKWTLPTSAVSVLVRCLKDESDECVRHYAARTIENVLAQGCPEHKARLVLADTAVRLLELSQHSRNDAMQGTSGMAVSHMFRLALSPQNHQYHMNLNTTINAKSAKRGDDTQPVGSGGRFVSRVLEKGGLANIVETLRDGAPKLQQAYLNIINTIFCPPSERHSNAANAKMKDSERESADVLAMQTTRQYFLRSSGLMLSLQRLVEQGGSSAVRAKALLTMQLLCRHSAASLITAAERRLPFILTRTLEPLATLSVDGSSAAATAGVVTVTYMAKSSLSMLLYLRELGISTLNRIASLMAGLMPALQSSAANAFSAATEPYSHRTPVKRQEARVHTPGTIVRHQTPTSAGPKSRTLTATRSQPDVLETESESVDTDEPHAGNNFDVGNIQSIMKDLREARTILRAVVSILSPHPILRNAFLSAGHRPMEALVSALRQVPETRAALQGHLEANREATKGSGEMEKSSEAFVALICEVELALLGTLEALIQIDVLDGMQNCRKAPARGAAHERILLPGAGERAFFAAATGCDLLASVAALVTHPEGDVRVIVASCLRRLLPSTLRVASWIQDHPHVLQDLKTPANTDASVYTYRNLSDLYPNFVNTTHDLTKYCVAVFDELGSMLTDCSPMPQYAHRLLCDLLQSFPTLASSIGEELYSRGTIQTLIQCLRANDGGRIDVQDGDDVSVADPQLFLLLKLIFDCGVLTGEAMAAELVSAVSAVSAVSEAEVEEHPAVRGSLSLRMIGGGGLATGVAAALSAAVEGQHGDAGNISVSNELIVALIELLHSILTYALKALSCVAAGNAKANATSSIDPAQGNAVVQMVRRFVAPLRTSIPVLFLLLTASASPDADKITLCIHPSAPVPGSASLASQAKGEGLSSTGAHGQNSVVHFIGDVVSRSLGILFDIFPEVLTSQLVLNHSIAAPAPSRKEEDRTASPQGVNPQGILAAALSNPLVDLRVRVRLLKVLGGVVRMAPSLGSQQQVRDMLRSQPLMEALSMLAKQADDSRLLSRMQEPERSLFVNYTTLAGNILAS